MPRLVYTLYVCLDVLALAGQSKNLPVRGPDRAICSPLVRISLLTLVNLLSTTERVMLM